MEYVQIPFTDMVPDAPNYDLGLSRVLGMVPHDIGLREVRGVQQLGICTPRVNPTVVASFTDPAGRIYFATTSNPAVATELWEYNPATNVIANVSPGGFYAGRPSMWSFTKFGSIMIAAAANVGVGAVIPVQRRLGTAGLFGNLIASIDQPAPKYVTTSKSHVVGANNLGLGGAGIYAAANPYQYMWSARNNAAVWQVGTDRANFAFVNDHLGELTGIVGFKDFFLLFQQLGVSRATWVGGDTVWELQDIGSNDFGMSANGFPYAPGAIVRSGRNAYYLSNRGPAMVVNGEGCQALGDGVLRRDLMDRSWLPPASDAMAMSTSAPMFGAFDPVNGYLAFSLTRAFPTVPFWAVYHEPSRRWTYVEPGVFEPPALGVALGLASTSPMDNFRFIGLLGADVAVNAFSSSTATVTAQLTTRSWRPFSGLRGSLAEVRPVIHWTRPGADPDPTMTLEIYAYPSVPAGAEPVPYTMSLAPAKRNDNGFWVGDSLPLLASEFRFRLTIPNLGANTRIRDSGFLELGYTGKSRN